MRRRRVGYPDTIVAHLDEEMREHLEFVLRRYSFELQRWLSYGSVTNKTNLEQQVELTAKCLKEIMEAGT